MAEPKRGLDDLLTEPGGPDAFADLLRGVDGGGIAWFMYGEFLAHTYPVPEPVIEGMARRGEVIGWHGAPGTGKSAAAVEACRSVSSGRALFGALPCRRGPAIYVEQESAPGLLQARLRDFEAGEALPEDAEPFVILPFQNLHFDGDEHREALRQMVEKVRPVLLIVDTISATAGTTDLLRPEAVGPWVAFFRGLATEFSVAVLLLGHEPKWADKQPSLKSFFGSVDWGAKMDGAFAFSRVAGQADTFRVACTKTRWTREEDGLDLTFTIGPGPQGGLVLTSATKREAVETILLAALEAGDWVPSSKVTKVATGEGYDERSAQRGVNRLVEEGRVETRGLTRSRQLRLVREEAS